MGHQEFLNTQRLREKKREMRLREMRRWNRGRTGASIVEIIIGPICLFLGFTVLTSINPSADWIGKGAAGLFGLILLVGGGISLVEGIRGIKSSNRIGKKLKDLASRMRDGL